MSQLRMKLSVIDNYGKETFFTTSSVKVPIDLSTEEIDRLHDNFMKDVVNTPWAYITLFDGLLGSMVVNVQRNIDEKEIEFLRRVKPFIEPYSDMLVPAS